MSFQQQQQQPRVMSAIDFNKWLIHWLTYVRYRFRDSLDLNLFSIFLTVYWLYICLQWYCLETNIELFINLHVYRCTAQVYCERQRGGEKVLQGYNYPPKHDWCPKMYNQLFSYLTTPIFSYHDTMGTYHHVWERKL